MRWNRFRITRFGT